MAVWLDKGKVVSVVADAQEQEVQMDFNSCTVGIYVSDEEGNILPDTSVAGGTFTLEYQTSTMPVWVAHTPDLNASTPVDVQIIGKHIAKLRVTPTTVTGATHYVLHTNISLQ
ncbi:hypothetical protein NVP1031O_074 [Vibrio phage 1.031.O._10N.261.46.F8]|nr:hypothetical protein NVP1031O_074 [Vibrio phage 1.031.O._10N.261.46.F8]